MAAQRDRLQSLCLSIRQHSETSVLGLGRIGLARVHGVELAPQGPGYLELEGLPVVAQAALDGPQAEVAQRVERQRDPDVGALDPVADGQLRARHALVPQVPGLREEDLLAVRRESAGRRGSSYGFGFSWFEGRVLRGFFFFLVVGFRGV